MPRSTPVSWKWGGVGNASDDAIIMYMLNNIAGIDLTYVPYDDGGMVPGGGCWADTSA